MILVECYLDEFLIKLLIKEMGFSSRLIKHEGGRGNVLNKLKNLNQGGVAVVDEDPHSAWPRDMKNYVKKEEKDGIKLFVRVDDSKKRLIQLSPYLEHWLLERAKNNNISPKDFSLPQSAKELHSIPHIERKSDFQRFVKEIVERDSVIKTFKKWLKNESK